MLRASVFPPVKCADNSGLSTPYASAWHEGSSKWALALMGCMQKSCESQAIEIWDTSYRIRPADCASHTQWAPYNSGIEGPGTLASPAHLGKQHQCPNLKECLLYERLGRLQEDTAALITTVDL